MTKARVAGVFYALTFVTGTVALVAGIGLPTANFISTLCYVGVTILFYDVFKPVNKAVSLVAALVSAFGCAMTILMFLRLVPHGLNVLPVFGVYCMLLGYLIFESGFMPRALGVVMAIGGLSWMTFASTRLAHTLNPYNFAPGILAEATLTIWLLAKGGASKTPPTASESRNLRTTT